MNIFSQFKGIGEISKIALVLVIGVIEIPLVIGVYNQNTPGEIFGLVASILILQPLAVAVGLGLGIYPVQVMLIVVSFGITVIFVLFGICDMFAERSAWLRQHLKKMETISQKSEMFRK